MRYIVLVAVLLPAFFAVGGEAAKSPTGTPPPFAYLADLKPSTVRLGYGTLGVNGDLGVDGYAMAVGGVAVKHGLGMHPTTNGNAEATYVLGGRYQIFRAQVAINDTASAKILTAVRFKVLGDGKPLWESKPTKRPGTKQDCCVAVTGVQELTLMVECPGDYYFAHALWIDPSVAAGGAQPPAGSERPPNAPSTTPQHPVPARAAEGRPAPPVETPRGAREPVPPPEKQKEAERVVRDVYREQFAKTSAQDQADLARKLLDQAIATRDDLASRYVLFTLAQDLAARCNDLATALRAAEQQGESFVVDAGKLKSKVLSQAERTARTKEHFQALAEAYAEWMESSAGKEAYDTALSCGAKAQQFATTAQEAKLLGSVAKRIQEIRVEKAAFEKVSSARETAFEKPNDPEANWVLGRFYFLARRDWDKGVACLAKCSDPKWRAAAQADLASPREASAQVQLADRWLELAAGIPKAEQEGVKARAAFWYKESLNELSGLSRAKVEKRLSELQSASTSSVGPTTGPASTAASRPAPGNVFPSREEIARLRELAPLWRRGDVAAREEAENIETAVSDRLTEAPETWTDEDFKARVRAEFEILTINKKNDGFLVVPYRVYGVWPRFAAGSRDDAQFVARAKEGKRDYGAGWIPDPVQASPWDRKLKRAIGLYLDKDPKRFATDEARLRFCDWLVSQGVKERGVNDYRQEIGAARRDGK